MPFYKDTKTKTNTYYVKFNYTDWQGNKKQKLKRGFKTQKEAKAYEHDFLANLSTDCTMAFTALVNHYLDSRKARVKPTTYETKSSIILKIIQPFFLNYSINEITPAIIEKFQNSLINSNKNYSATYLRTINSTLSALFNYAVKFFKLNSNPVRIAGTIGKGKSNRMDIWTQEDFIKFINTLTRQDDFAKQHLHRKVPATSYALAYKLLFYGGFREGELLALTINDFDTQAGTITINKTLAVIKGHIIIQPPKTLKSSRVVPMPDFICQQLKEYISSMVEPEPTDRLFPLINKHSILQVMNCISEKAGLKKIRIHDLRHSHASLLIERGFSPLMIADRLGHEKVQTTLDIYSHLYPNKADEISKDLQNLAF